MHDTFLFKKIALTLEKMCKENHINKITKLEIDVHNHSHINSLSLYEHLQEEIPELVDENTKVIVEVSENVEELNALIKYVEGSYEEKIPD